MALPCTGTGANSDRCSENRVSDTEHDDDLHFLFTSKKRQRPLMQTDSGCINRKTRHLAPICA